MSERVLEAIETALAANGRPLTAQEIASEISLRGDVAIGGATPWKTVGARLAVDIRNNPGSRFKRAGRGLYSLTSWQDVKAVAVPPRKINPMDEEILAVPAEQMKRLKSCDSLFGIYSIHYSTILAYSLVVNRTIAEEREDIIQLIPSFLIFRVDEVLTFKRTRKTPESRLHDSFSIIFGGHLQADDIPELFQGEVRLERDFLFRELREELKLSPEFRQADYVGVIHLDQTPFERQHAGVVFAIDLPEGGDAKSLEPGYHSSLQFMKLEELRSSPIMDDRWSRACLDYLGRG